MEESGSCLRVRCVVNGPESKGVPCESLRGTHLSGAAEREPLGSHCGRSGKGVQLD